MLDLHVTIGMAHGAAVGYRKKERENPMLDEPLNFINWFCNVHVLVDLCKNDTVLRDKTINDMKTAVRSKKAQSKRIFWFGTMLGWLQTTKEFPFSHDTATAYLDVLESSGIVSSFEYQMENPSTETPLLCRTPLLVNEHALTKAMNTVFAQSGNDQDEEVKECQSKIQMGAFGGKTDFDLSMNLFMESWFACVGRFKAAWQDDEQPASPKEKKGPH